MSKIDKLYFLGAGSTACLKLPTTKRQNDIIKDKVFNNSNDDFSAFVKYFFNESNLDINNLYNILDSFIIDNKSIYIKDKRYDKNDFLNFRNEIAFTIYNEFNASIRENNKASSYLFDFYKKLATKALEKKVREYNQDVAVKRDFIFTDYAIVNLNWDLYSIMPMFLAHQQLNNVNNYYLSKSRNNAKLKIFNDLGMQFACNARENKDIWYPYNESVASRINQPEYGCSRVVTLVRSYFPHGLMNLYQCKCCGKHVLNLGDLKYEDIVKDRNLLENNEVLKCPFCGNPIKEFDLDVLLQSNFKIISNYLKEIRYDMINALKSTNEIIFIGYSLPSDDADYMILFRNIIGSNPNVKVKVVLYDSNSNKNEFKTYNTNNISQLNKDNQEIVNRYKNLFGENVLFNFAGSPECFNNEEIY